MTIGEPQAGPAGTARLAEADPVAGVAEGSMLTMLTRATGKSARSSRPMSVPSWFPPSCWRNSTTSSPTRRGIPAELAALTELSGGAWDLPPLAAPDIRRVRDLVDRYRDQDIGLADASLVLLATRYRTDRVLALDRRHFTVVRTTTGKPFTVLPR